MLPRPSIFRTPKSLLLFIPVVLIPLILPSGEGRGWYESGLGWPWHYGLLATDIPVLIPSVVSMPALVGDLVVGAFSALVLWFLVRYIFVNKES
jgi:hypothetical protein